MMPEVLTCISFRRDLPSSGHDLARSFRAGNPDAFAEVLASVRLAVAPHATRLFAPGTIGVSVPGHRAGSVNGPCESLLAALAAEFPDLTPTPGVLSRIRDAPWAQSARTRDPHLETATLRWAELLVPANARTVLLVDDVLRSGATLTAALMAMPAGLASSTLALAVFHAVSR